MSKNGIQFSRTKAHLAVCNVLAVGLVLASLEGAQAADFKVGDLDLTVNSTVSVGSSWRVEGRDRRLFSARNTDEGGTTGLAPTPTTDDGNLNFDTGDRFSTVVKGIHEFELKKNNEYGFFSRVKWFYDDALNSGGVSHGHAGNAYTPGSALNDNGFHPYSRFDGLNLLDAYGYMNTSVAGKPANIRLGRQVIAWGESMLIQSPISGLNTVDLSALRRPGVDLKEAFTPSEHVFMNLGLSEGTSLEGFVQLKWRETVTEGCGTYFAANDIVGDGCNFISVPPAGFTDRTAFLAASAGALGTGVFRAPDSTPDDGGQYGLALRKYVGSLGTEFGAYYMNYHSRLPVLSAVKQTAALGSSATAAFTARYKVEYPEDIRIFGASFSTNVGSWAWAGEVSRAQDVPLQINTADILIAVLNPTIGATTHFGQRYQNGAVAAGQTVAGYDRFDVTQLQSSLIRQFDRVLGSNRMVFVGEVGATFVHDLPEANAVAGTPRYGRSPVFGTASASLGLPAADGSTAGGFVTDFAWGYRLRLTSEYRDVFEGIDLSPSIAWSHDVDGWSPEPGQSFNEGRQSIGVGLGFEFDANTRASINYVKYVNSAEFDVFRDRDFISVSASHSF